MIEGGGEIEGNINKPGRSIKLESGKVIPINFEMGFCDLTQRELEEVKDFLAEVLEPIFDSLPEEFS